MKIKIGYGMTNYELIKGIIKTCAWYPYYLDNNASFLYTVGILRLRTELRLLRHR